MKKIIVNTLKKKSKINKNIYGHFSEHLGRCIYEGLYVGDNSKIPNKNGMRIDVVEALKNIKIPVLRWPGGCFADEYHWKDGIGPKENRKKMINNHWGGVVEDNSFGTHEFFELCKQIEAEPYINGNVGSGSVVEMQEWIEYMTSSDKSPMADLRRENGQEEPWKLKYFGVGNENWGCGGNMRPEYYSDVYRRFQTYIRNYSDNKIFKIACGANSSDYNWTEILMKNSKKFMNALTLHYYTLPEDSWNNKGSATEFTKEDYYKTLKKTYKMEELLKKHIGIMDEYDDKKDIGLIVDEWGAWYNVEPGTNPGFLYQQNTMRDAMIAAINLNIFNEFSDRVIMTNIAQTVNVLQSVILTEGEKMVLTPTYYVYDLYKEHQDGTLLDTFIETDKIGINKEIIDNITISSSISENGKVNITLANCDIDNNYEYEIELIGENIFRNPKGRILKGNYKEYNDFDNHNLEISDLDNLNIIDNKIKITIPKCSVLNIVI